MIHKLVLFVSLLLVVSVSSAVYAQEETDTTPTPTLRVKPIPSVANERMKERVKTAREKMAEVRQNAKDNLCRLREGRLNVIGEWLASARNLRAGVYQTILKNANELIAKAEEQGIDASTLKSNLEELNALLNTLSEDVKNLESAINKAEGVTCDESDREATRKAFLAAKNEVYAASRKVKQDKAKAHAYARSKILPEMKKLLRNLNSKKERDGT